MGIKQSNGPTSSKANHSIKQSNDLTFSKANHSIKHPNSLNSNKTITPTPKVNKHPDMQTSVSRVPKTSQEGAFGGEEALKHGKDSKVGTQETTSAKQIKNNPKTTSLYLSNRVPLESQKGYNGGQAALQYPEESQVGIHKYTQARNIPHDLNNRYMLGNTPKITGVHLSPKKLFHEEMETNNEVLKIPTDTDLEVLLINSCRIDATKVQTIVTNFIEDKDYTTIFCMTETKVD